jgi:acetyltransferase-like isoleucine patch superfamily enzyme
MRSIPRVNYGRVFRDCVYAFLAVLPNHGVFYRLRLRFLRLSGYELGEGVTIATGTWLQGRVSIGRGTHLAHYCVLSGGQMGITIGERVMLGPHVVVVAFDHGHADLTRPMIEQDNIERRVVIEDDCWIGANTTVTSGVTVGRGSIVGANSVVTRDVEPYSVVAGVPARLLRSRSPA